MRRHWQYLKYVFRHKWYVFWAGLWLHVPIWSLIIHDWDKFLPGMWWSYATCFYASDGSKQYQPSEWFLENWNAHQKRNKHHWQHHILMMDSGEQRVLYIPDVHRREMLADWIGAGMAMGKPFVWEWYAENKDRMLLHPLTRHWIEAELADMENAENQQRMLGI